MLKPKAKRVPLVPLSFLFLRSALLCVTLTQTQRFKPSWLLCSPLSFAFRKVTPSSLSIMRVPAVSWASRLWLPRMQRPPALRSPLRLVLTCCLVSILAVLSHPTAARLADLAFAHPCVFSSHVASLFEASLSRFRSVRLCLRRFHAPRHRGDSPSIAIAQLRFHRACPLHPKSCLPPCSSLVPVPPPSPPLA